MSRRVLLCLFCLSCLVLVVVQDTSARYEISVNESATRFFFKQLAPEVSLVIDNGQKHSSEVVVRVEILSPDNKVVGTTERHVELKSGSNKIPFVLPFHTRSLSPDEDSKILWYRLRYRISDPSTVNKTTLAEGLISLSAITPGLFELRVIAPGYVYGGTAYQARVLARHPLTHRPAEGVDIKAAITIDDTNKTTLIGSATTDRDGFADLNFKLPRQLNDDFELKIEGTRGITRVAVSQDIDVFKVSQLIVSTDKPLYQPGQTVHSRVLMLGPNKLAVASKDITVTVTDPEDTVVFSRELRTSRFGIASADWAVPTTTRLGDYRLKFEADDEELNQTTVKVSRYDLPTFAVEVKPDRSYYLPGQHATVRVRADYLFGQPVTRGHVKVVREDERSWNYREQKYDVTEGDKYEGDTDADGYFTAKIDLKNDHKEIADEDYRRFKDLSYAAYFTDPSTNRTEQRRFNLRVTREAIHIYVVHLGNNYYENPRMPIRFYLSTFYADGEPAPCNVTIRNAEGAGPVVARVKTNAYGVGKIDQLRIHPARQQNTLTLAVLAEDQSGRTGKHSEDFDFRDAPGLQLSTDKSLFRPGEPISLEIKSTELNFPLTVTVSRNASVLKSQTVRLHNNRASVLIPYQPDFKDQLLIQAYADLGEERLIADSRSILYPRNRDLTLKLQTAKTYKPGEQAHVTFEAKSAEGRNVESALGVVVLDKAVEERVRTNEDFGSRSAGFYRDISGLLGYGDSLGFITRKVLDQVGLSKEISSDLDLAAEVLLNQNGANSPNVFGSDNYEQNLASLFLPPIGQQLDPLKKALTKSYEQTKIYPTAVAAVRRVALDAGIDFDSLKDPWGSAYRASFEVDHAADVFSMTTAGPDKSFGTEDDFAVLQLSWPYFRPIGEAIDQAVREYHVRTGSFIRDYNALRDELRPKGIDLQTLQDRWSRPYEFRFEVEGSQFAISVWSSVPQGAGDNTDKDEFKLWHSTIDYFAERRAQIDSILTKHFHDTGQFPINETELKGALQSANVDLETLKDPWTRRYYATFQQVSYYGDNVSVESRAVYGQSSSEKVKITPVTKTATVIKMRSGGADGVEGTNDDFDVATFSTTVTEQSAKDRSPERPRISTTHMGATGAITGRVDDPLGAAIPGATIEAKRQSTDEVFSAKTDDSGRYLLRNLPAGIYEFKVSASAFKPAVITNILVRSSDLVEINVTLEVGAVAETVSVVSGSDSVSYLNASVAQTISRSNLVLLAPGLVGAKQQIFTPRLREYFPETLLWQPELTTDKKGRAQLDFKLADNITTWKLSVIGSTENGELGIADTEIRAFQPFFAELDPPRVLTEGDEIALPVVLRNYLDKKQPVDLQLAPQAWFRSLDGTRKQVEVPARDSSTSSFKIQTTASVIDGKQQVTAIGSDLSDAIVKPITVHPDGEEKAETATALLTESTLLQFALPADTIANSSHVELKVYPNLTSHIYESVEAIMKRPYGCGEQTISSTYPSLLVLRHLRVGQANSEVIAKAERYLQEGYQRLLGYQGADGGFTYWGHGDSDVALTAYALRFLHDAEGVTEVDPHVAERARTWLFAKQRSDGSWQQLNWDKTENRRGTALLTAHVARSIALANDKPDKKSTNDANLVRTLDYLEKRSSEIEEPYLIAAYSLAASVAGDKERALQANRRLIALAHPEGDRTYWSLETNTPFYGWGLAGRIETTALVVQSLGTTMPTLESEQQQVTNAQSRGLLFLLRNEDPYGVWYSTQATINVLDAILSVAQRQTEGIDSGDGVAVVVNGQPATSFRLPVSSKIAVPFTADISAHIKAGINRIELKRTGKGKLASVQAVTSYYVPWSSNQSSSTARVSSGDSEALQLQTAFDKTEARVMDEITCHVKAERIGFRGYGMMLAEIGLPPGVDVDRASLETATKGSGWSINQYDVLPDRIVFYLWPTAGGVSFNFRFKPRIAMKAKAAASVLYDYYNPEARTIVQPGTFVVK
ncbi:MAG: hypothetical protein C5B55_14240 [Blastocatellia bacterium]|nr:MAG: hypothetical protein C5B55_14240 [Blastocatellia bacterium]